MPKPIQHTRITSLPVPESICAGQLDAFFTESHDRRMDFVVEYHALVPADSGKLFECNGKIFERIRGVYLPRRLRFSAIKGLEISGLYEELGSLPADQSARTIVDMYNWLGKGESLYFYLLFGRSEEDAEFRFFAHGVTREERSGEPISFSLERDWSPAPPMPARPVPQPGAIYQRFGGDPITIQLNGKTQPRRLFIGGQEVQPGHRPQVGAVLNLGEEPSRWVKDGQSPASDRWINKGEGSLGMRVDEIRLEAEWVIERLRSGQRALVHCMAGMNRSVTVCCAVLILLEGLTAEAALERVRQRHPWARPDSHHWLTLKWLAAKTNHPK